MPQSIFIIACEPSADAHGSRLVKELRSLRPGLEFRGLGGPKMEREGVRLMEDMTEISALGFGDVVAKYLTFRKIFYRALDEVRKNPPDLLIVIDSPAFNLRFAKKIQKRIPTVYYISPQIWAWGGRRIHAIKKNVTQMISILPFEEELYRKAGVPCKFVGHPLIDHLPEHADRQKLRDEFGMDDVKAVGLLAGSRVSEVERIFPLMLETAKNLHQSRPDTSFFVSQSKNVPRTVYEKYMRLYPGLPLRIIESELGEFLEALDFAFITSGTATLEAALIGTPFFLFYKASWTTYVLGRMLIRVPYLGMANLLSGRAIVPEFIQNSIKPDIIARQALAFLENPAAQEEMKKAFDEVKRKLGEKGASARTAALILNLLPAETADSPRQTPVG